MSAPAETPTPVPAPHPEPTLPYAPERRTEVERLCWGAAIAADYGCDAYGDPAVTRMGGAR